MKWRNIATIYFKELRDLLRDRRTVISMIVVPTLIMPGLMLVVGLISYRIVNEARSTVPTIMVIGGDDSPLARGALAAVGKVAIVPNTSDWKQRIADKKVRAVVEFPAGFDAALKNGEPAAIKIYHYEGELRSTFAVNEVRRFFTDYLDQVVAARLAGRGLPAGFVRPFEVRAENVAPPEKVGGNVIGGIIPYFFLLLSFTGAMYPAMDLTAGEKERGTMEMILCSPVARVDLVLGKFFMVLTASLTTVVCSLLSMGCTFLAGGALLNNALGDGAGGVTRAVTLPTLDPLGVLAVIGMVVPMAVLFSAVLLTASWVKQAWPKPCCPAWS